MSKFNRDHFKNELLAAGYDWSDQKIDNYIAYKNAANNLKIEQTKTTNPALYDTIRKWESGDRATHHNNPGAHIWTKELGDKFGAVKGQPFQDRLGNTLYTAKYDTLDAGDKATNFVIDKLAAQNPNPEAFVSAYTGLSSNNPSYANYVNDVASSGLLNPSNTMPIANQSMSNNRRFDESIGSGAQGRSSVWDALGNFAWTFGDLSTFGALGGLDPERLLGYEKNTLQKALTGVAPGEAPKSFAGRVGQGLGGAAGFLAPMGVVKKGLSAVARNIPGLGASNAAKKFTSSASKFLQNDAGEMASQRFSQLTSYEKAHLFKPIVNKGFATTAMAKQSTKIYKDNWTKKIQKSIKERLENAGIAPVMGKEGNVAQLTKILNDAVFLNGKHVMRTHDLQQTIALALGGTRGAGKLAQIVSHAAEEAVLFAAVETPMEYFSAQNEERLADYQGTLKHALGLGSVLGLVKFVPGGKDWGTSRGIMRTGLRRLRQNMSKKRAYDKIDVNTAEGREVIANFSRAFYNSGAKTIMNSAKTPRGKEMEAITSIGQITRMAATPKGANDLRIKLKAVEDTYNSQWKDTFFKEAAEDMRGSLGRMAAGSMAFNTSLVFDDVTPLEDKVFHIALGAFMSKPGRTLKYINKSTGQINVTETGAYKPLDKELIDANFYLNKLNMPLKDFLAEASINDQIWKNRFLPSMEDSPDLKKLNELYKKLKIIDKNDGSERQTPKDNAAKRGDHEIYETAKLLFDQKSSMDFKLRDVETLTVKEVQAIEKALKEAKFDAFDGGARGVESPNDMYDIIDEAATPVYKELRNHYATTAETFENLMSKDGSSRPIKFSDGTEKLQLRQLKAVGLNNKNQLLFDAAQRNLKTAVRTGKVKLDRNERNALEITNQDMTNKYKELTNHYNDMDEIINKLIQGDINTTSMNRGVTLMQEDYLNAVMELQAFNRGIKETYIKFKDFDNANGETWKTKEGEAEPSGVTARRIINSIFHQNEFVASRFEFGSKVSQEYRDFANGYLQALRKSPFANVSLIKNVEKPTKLDSNQELKKLKEIFEYNGIEGFSKNNEQGLQSFINSYVDYQYTRAVRGFKKADGKLLSGVDRAVVSELTKQQMVGKNFQAVEMLMPIDAATKVIDPKSMDTEQMLRNIQQGAKGKEISEAIEVLVTEYGISQKEFLTELHTNYTDLIKPYLKSNKGGFLKTTGTVAQVDAAKLGEMYESLKFIQKTKKIVTSNELVREFEKLRNNENLDTASQQMLNDLYSMYNENRVSATAIIRELSKNELYDLDANKLKLDFDNPSLAQELKSILKQVEKDNLVEYDVLVANNVKELQDKKTKPSEVELDLNMTPQNFKAKYTLDKEYSFYEKGNPKSFEEIAKDVSVPDSKQPGKFIKYENFSSDLQRKFEGDFLQINFNSDQSRKISELSFVANSGIEIASDKVYYDNSLYKHLDILGGKDKNNNNIKIPFDIVNADIILPGNKTVNIFTDTQARLDLIKRLGHKGKEVYLDSKYGVNDMNRAEYTTRDDGGIFISVGEQSLNIQKSGLPYLAANYKKLMSEWRKKYKGSENETIITKLEKSFDSLFKENSDNPGTYLLNELSPKYQSSHLQKLVNFSWMSDKLGTYWWNHSKSIDYLDVSNVASRQKLMANISMKELSYDHIKVASDVFNAKTNNKFNYEGKQYDKIRKSLKNISDKKENVLDVIIVDDSGLEASVLNKAYKNWDMEIAKSKDGTGKQNSELSSIDLQQRLFREGKDITDVDSYVAVSKDRMDLLYSIMGLDPNIGHGGIKPIIHRYGDNVIIGKTAFVHGAEFNNFFKNNPVNAIMFESASKINYDANRNNVLKDWKDINSLNNLKLQDNFKIEGLKPEDISLGAVIKPDHASTISFQKQMHIKGAEQNNDFFNTYMRKNLQDWEQMVPELFSSSDNAGNIAKAQFLNRNKNLMDESLYSMWIEANGLPQAGYGIKDKFMGALKSEYLDKGILKVTTENGGQSVLSPGTDLRYFHPLKDKKVYSYGEGMLPNVAGEKPINLKNLTFAVHYDTKTDRLVTHTDLIKDKALQKELGIENFKDIEFKSDFTLKQALDLTAKLSELNFGKPQKPGMDNNMIQIAAMFGRNPSTRPGDMPIVGIKGLLSKDYGNQVKINSWDLAMRLEGDYDVDKADYWYDSPKSFIKRQNDLSTRVIRAVPSSELTKNSIPSDMSWDNPATINAWRGNTLKAQKTLGIIMRAPRAIRALTDYNSDSIGNRIKTDGDKEITGFTLRRSGAEGGGKIYIDPEKMKNTLNLIGEDAQNIVDYKKGYNVDLYGNANEWFKTALFGDGFEKNSRYPGIFSVAKSKDKDGVKSWEGQDASGKVSVTEQEMILAAIKPYRDMMGIGGNEYSTGKPVKQKYDDIISAIRTYNAQTKNLHKSIYHKLKNKEGVDTGLLKSLLLKNPNKPSYYYENNKGIDNFKESPFGNWQETIRPGTNVEGKDLKTFERTLAHLYRSDKTNLELPDKLYNNALKIHHDFYEKHMFGENNSQYVDMFIKKLNDNNDRLNQINYNDFQLKKAREARNNALQYKNMEKVEQLDYTIQEMKSKQQYIEEFMIDAVSKIDEKGNYSKGFKEKYNADSQKVKFAKEIASGVQNAIGNRIIRELRTPKGWNKTFKKQGDKSVPMKPERWYEDGTGKATKAAAAYVKKHSEQLRQFAKENGIQIESINSFERLEVVAADLMLRNIDGLYLHNPTADKQYYNEMQKNIRDLSKLHSKHWGEVYGKTNHTLTTSKVGNILEREVARLFKKWNSPEMGGQGRLFLFQMMKPKKENFMFSYYGGEFYPSYKKESLAMFKMGLRFITGSNPVSLIEFDPMTRQQIVKRFANGHRNIVEAAMGRDVVRDVLGGEYLSHLKHDTNSIYEAAPLIDDIRRWSGGVQEMDLNPMAANALGYQQAPLAYTLSHRTLDPSIVKTLTDLSYMAFNPKAYIRTDKNLMNHPSINGIDSYYQAKKIDDKIFLGSAMDMNLIRRASDVPRSSSLPFEDSGVPKVNEKNKALNRAREMGKCGSK